MHTTTRRRQADEGFEQQLRVERAHVLRRFAHWIDPIMLAAAVLAGALFWNRGGHAAILSWLAMVGAATGVMAVFAWGQKNQALSLSRVAFWERNFLLLMVILGVAWGSGGVLLFQPDSTVHQVALSVFLMLLATLSLGMLAGYLRVYMLYSAALAGPMIFRLMIAADPSSVLIAMGSIVGLIALWMLAAVSQEQSDDNLRVRRAVAGLGESLDDAMTARTQLQTRIAGEQQQARFKNSELFDLARDVSIAGGDLRSALQVISAKSAKATGGHRISIWLMHSSPMSMKCVHVFENGEHQSRAHALIEQGDCPALFEALPQNRAVPVTNIRRTAAYQKFWHYYFKRHGIGAALFVPFRQGRKLLGVICHEWRGPVREWTQSEMNFAGSFADFMALAIATAQRRRTEEDLRKLANYDPLTNLPNRTMFQERLEQALARARRSKQRLALLFIDVDRFKGVNDSLGHQAGDQVLTELAKRLPGCVRAGDTVSRLGGDEFTVIMENVQSAKAITFTCERILSTLLAPLTVRGTEVHLSCSVGISVYPNDGEDVTTLLKNADSAMYKAKESGRNNFQFFTPDMQARALQRLSQETALRNAVKNSEFLLYYQPQFDTRNGGIVGLEALVRWNSPTLGMVSPAEFIPVAEDTGLIVPLGDWVLKEACWQIKEWSLAGYNHGGYVAVNFSVRQFSMQDIPVTVKRVLEVSGLPPRMLQVEITESMVMRDIDASVAILEELKLLGVRIALDDFGTEHSSLGYLKRLPVDVIKLDRTFVRNITIDAYDAAIARCIIMLADRLRITMIAEGVETVEQMQTLQHEGCHLMQGFLFSEPLPAEECGRLLLGKLDLAV